MKPNEYAKACLGRLVPKLVTITGGVVDESGGFWGFRARAPEGTPGSFHWDG